MFGEIKEMAKLASLLKNGPAIQSKIGEARARLGQRTVTVEAGAGAVTVVADGTPKIRSIVVEPALLAALCEASHDRDRALAASLITEAVNDALVRAQAMMMEEMAAAASEMNLPIPKQMLEGLLQRPAGG